jgi:hypothetical protein
MKNSNEILSPRRLERLRMQGYINYSDKELSSSAFGIRFAYRACVAVLITAIALQSTVLFSIMTGIALFGILLPNHPFDYVYNVALSGIMKRPKLRPRSKQLKFACTIATIWLAAVVYLMTVGYVNTALILAGVLVVVAILPSTIDLCVPSIVYQMIFGAKEKDSEFCYK